MPDSLNPQEAYHQAGIEFALSKQARTVRINNLPYRGIRTELTLSTDAQEYGGKKIKRAFSMLIPRSVYSADLKDGVEIHDDLGRKYWISNVTGDAVQQTLTCVGLWG